MTATDNTAQSRFHLVAVAAFLLLGLAIGRIASLVMHEPLLAYANNYDMIRVQACHQVWPADDGVSITQGTPEAPLRHYTFNKHVDTPCVASSALLFSGIATGVATLTNRVTGEDGFDMRLAGITAAIFLCGTLLLVSMYFFTRRNGTALLVNGLVALLALSDPGVTLYLNTFYPEFAAAYFLYLSLAGAAMLVAAQWRTIWCLPVLAGLIGLAFSKPQHLPLALLLAGLLALYAASRRQWLPAALLLLAALLPPALQAGRFVVTQDKSMALASKVNLTGSVLGLADNPPALLQAMQLPAGCAALAGKNWYHPAVQQNNPCPELQNTSRFTIAVALLRHPPVLNKLLRQAMPAIGHWLIDSYGQVEQGKTAMASRYQRSIGDLLPRAPSRLHPLLLTAGFLLAAWLGVSGRLPRREPLFLLLLLTAQLAILALALLQGGLTGLARHLHLYLPLSVASTGLGLLLLGRATLLRFTKNHQPRSGDSHAIQ